MSKIKITIEGDAKFSGYMLAAIHQLVDPEKTPITKISAPHLEQGKISFEMESRI